MADSNIDIKALGEANLANNNNGDITPQKMRENLRGDVKSLRRKLVFILMHQVRKAFLLIQKLNLQETLIRQRIKLLSIDLGM